MADVTSVERARLVCALVDGSSYAGSVAEHGAWLAERLRATLELRHVREESESPQEGRRLLQALAAGIADQGAPSPRLSLGEGGLLANALSAEASALIMGKRGQGSDETRRSLGRHVEALVRATAAPLCLASQVFLPIHRVVAVTDADPNRRAAIDLVAAHAREDVDLDVVVVFRQGETPAAKLAMARQALDGRAMAFAIRAERIGEAVWRYLVDRPSDLIVISRAVLLGDGGPDLRSVAPGSLWAARASVVVC